MLGIIHGFITEIFLRCVKTQSQRNEIGKDLLDDLKEDIISDDITKALTNFVCPELISKH